MFHPFKMSTFFREREAKNCSNLWTDSSKKLPIEGGGVKNCRKFADMVVPFLTSILN